VSTTTAGDDLLVTAEGYERLCSELEMLRTEGRRAMSERLREARADGDLEDNRALFDVLEEQARLEGRIAALEARLAAARIAEPTRGGRAGIGSSVVLRDLETSNQIEYELVGAIEADIGRRRLSIDAPVGRALLGAGAGDALNVACPRGEAPLGGDQRRRSGASGEGGCTVRAALTATQTNRGPSQLQRSPAA
jgi:transcription elongation factor GreA